MLREHQSAGNPFSRRPDNRVVPMRAAILAARVHSSMVNLGRYSSVARVTVHLGHHEGSFRTGSVNMAAQSSASLHTFFTRYAALAQKSAAEDLAAMYAPTFIVASYRGSEATSQIILDSWTGYSRLLIQPPAWHAHVDHRKIEELSLSARHVLATVRWGSQFDRLGDRVIEFDIVTTSRAPAMSGRSCSYVSQQRSEGTVEAARPDVSVTRHELHLHRRSSTDGDGASRVRARRRARPDLPRRCGSS